MDASFDEGFGPSGAPDAEGVDALFTSPTGAYELELRGVVALHMALAGGMAQLQDEQVAFPPTHWQVTSVDLARFQELESRFAQAFWGIMDFADQPGGAFAFMEPGAAALLVGASPQTVRGDQHWPIVEHLMQHLAAQFGACWQEIAAWEVQMYPSQEAPSMGDLSGTFDGLNSNTPLVVTSFRVTLLGPGTTGRVAIAIPQAYLMTMGEGLRAYGEYTKSNPNHDHIHERLSYLSDVPVPVVVELGRTELTVGELHALEPGDVLGLDSDVARPLRVRVGNMEHQGRPGTTPDGRYLAIQMVGG